jgi:mannose-6-phosphate isomerase-like protein (cupin superfamily)
MTSRRVITADVDDRSAVLSDEELAPIVAGTTTSLVPLWRSDQAPTVPYSGAMSVSFDPPSPGAVWVLRYILAPGESADVPGFHLTDSVDVNVVLEGVVTVELDDGVELDLHVGQCIVVNGNMHAWHNRTTAAASMLVTMVGASRGDRHAG